MKIKYMKLAIDEAYRGVEEGGMPFGCCLVNEDEGITILSHNESIKRHSPIEHAEIIALKEKVKKNCDRNEGDWTIYCTTKPCIMCLGAIYWSQVKNVVYGTNIECLNKVGIEDIEYDMDLMQKSGLITDVQAGVLEDECQLLLEKWEKKNRLLKQYLSLKRKRLKHENQ